ASHDANRTPRRFLYRAECVELALAPHIVLRRRAAAAGVVGIDAAAIEDGASAGNVTDQGRSRRPHQRDGGGGVWRRHRRPVVGNVATVLGRRTHVDARCRQIRLGAAGFAGSPAGEVGDLAIHVIRTGAVGLQVVTWRAGGVTRRTGVAVGEGGEDAGRNPGV